jgi:2-keto-3-deoxy-L-rhamnonate aldolase RhmA
VGIVPIVRIPEIRREPVLKCLEAGAQGILAPQVETRSQVEELVSYVRYAPAGNRGVSLTRPHTGYRTVARQEYMSEANRSNLIILQIETRRAIENLDELLAVDGVDCALVGPNDLAQSLTQGRNDAPEEVAGAIEKVASAAAHHGLVSGIHCSKVEDVAHWLAKGMRMCMWSTDVGMLMAEGRRGLAALRQA